MTANLATFGNWDWSLVDVDGKTQVDLGQDHYLKSQERRRNEENIRRILLPGLDEVLCDDDFHVQLKKRLPIFVEICNQGSDY